MDPIINSALDFFLFLYLVSGSSSFGYILLRIGWPKIRVLKPSYKKGWSIIFGASFFIAISILSLIFSLIPFFGFGFKEFLFLFISLSFLLAVVALTIMRKFFKKSRMNVSVPGSFVQAKVAAQKAKNKLQLDPGLVLVSGHGERLEKLKKALDEKKSDSLNNETVAESIHKPKHLPGWLLKKVPEKQKEEKNKTVAEIKPKKTVPQKLLEFKPKPVNKKEAKKEFAKLKATFEKEKLKTQKVKEIQSLKKDLKTINYSSKEPENELKKVQLKLKTIKVSSKEPKKEKIVKKSALRKKKGSPLTKLLEEKKETIKKIKEKRKKNVRRKNKRKKSKG